ncbi:hypothetical protein DFJ63DRAFT_264230 [Scheffersomyces coipomensis]|uniref:uncharacterized protein n=1 Tax=Scheffersomyces coipomensis TaxID=1788519 RepID=UPI00315D0AA7
MPTPPSDIVSEYIINISSDDDVDDTDLQIIEEYRKETQDLLDNPDQPHHETIKKLSDSQCPVCFDEMTEATATSCGHMFCLECIQQSLSSSNARGQVRRHGVGLCPLCRKQVTFKDTIILRMKVAAKIGIPPLPPPKPDIDTIIINTGGDIKTDEVIGDVKQEVKSEINDLKTDETYTDPKLLDIEKQELKSNKRHHHHTHSRPSTNGSTSSTTSASPNKKKLKR